MILLTSRSSMMGGINKQNDVMTQVFFYWMPLCLFFLYMIRDEEENYLSFGPANHK